MATLEETIKEVKTQAAKSAALESAPNYEVPTSNYKISEAPDYSVNMNDERFGKVDESISNMEDNLDLTYGGAIGGADKFYKDLQDESQRWADEQVQLQKENTDFAIQKIEQQKAQAEKDYLKEQSAAYGDWQRQSNPYGVEAEKMASAGLSNSGYSESSQVSMYNTYQNRVATARDAIERAKQEYNNNINQAILQNNAAMAEIYANAHKEQLQLVLESYLHNEQLSLELVGKKLELENVKWNRYMDVYNQINTENAMAEEIRQFNERIKFEAEENRINREFQVQLEEIRHNYDKKLALLEQEYKLDYLKADTQAKKDVLDKELEIAKEKLTAEREEAEKLAKYEFDLKKQSVGTVSGGGGSGGSSDKPAYMDSPGYVGSSQPKVNMDSVTALGYGPISATRLAELEAEGKIESYVKNGQIYYKRVTTSPYTFKEVTDLYLATGNPTLILPSSRFK